MDTDLKREIKEIIEVIKDCPENVQVRAFELLLQDYLTHQSNKKHYRQCDTTIEKGGDGASDHRPKERTGIESVTIPMRLKAFLKKYSIDLTFLAKLFHIEEGEVIPIWDVEATKTSQAQIEISLYCALKQALQKGEFLFDRDEVKSLCEEKGVHPKQNFNANYKNNEKLFAGLDKSGQISLTTDGMSRLAELILGTSASK